MVSESQDKSKAYEVGLGLLARREHSTRELLSKLHSRGFDADVAQAAHARLVAENLQSDERYTEVYLRQRSAKGYGPLRIRTELRERGIDEGLISAQFRRAEENGELDWYELAAGVYRKKYGGLGVDGVKERAKRIRFLQYRGFDHEQIAAAMADA